MTRWDATDIPDQSGRTVVVTGANSGLGLRSAEALARAGAGVVMACRSAERAAPARDRVAAGATGPDPTVVALDLADLASVRAAAASIAARAGHVDVLMNNAGIMAVPRAATADGFELQFGTNHLGHFALTGLLLPALLAAPAPRVVTTSSSAHRAGRAAWDDARFDRRRYRRWAAYGRSKLANLQFTGELARRAAAAGTALTAVAAHPGYARTHLGAGWHGAERAGAGPLQRLRAAAMVIGDRVLAQSDAAGALPQLYAATMDDVAAGDYFGPGGPFEMRGVPTRVTMSAAARDTESAARLWALSEELTGVTYDWPQVPAAGRR
ncbi:MAG TPA: oxidoreductase [Acidimicrobiales bacterium]|nr:oxidoreductase [Acidimicrobiales bacterium]